VEPLQIFRPFKKALGSYREELGGIDGAISIEEGIEITANISLKLLVISLQDARPGNICRAVAKDRRAVASAAGTVELVCEFVEDNIMTIINVGGDSADIVPGKNDRAVMPRFTQTDVLTFGHHTAPHMLGPVGHVCLRIYKYGKKAWIVIGLAVEKKESRLSGDRDTHLFGEFEPPASFESFFSEQDVDVSVKFLAVLFR